VVVSDLHTFVPEGALLVGDADIRCAELKAKRIPPLLAPFPLDPVPNEKSWTLREGSCTPATVVLEWIRPFVHRKASGSVYAYPIPVDLRFLLDVDAVVSTGGSCRLPE
jgi:hypothetical protein